VREVGDSGGYKAESHEITDQRHVPETKNNFYRLRSWKSNTVTHGPLWSTISHKYVPQGTKHTRMRLKRQEWKQITKRLKVKC